MFRKISALFLGLAISLSTIPLQGGTVFAAGATVITVDPTTVLGTIPQTIFGANQRYFGKACGTYDTTNKRGYPDFVNKYQDMGITTFRYHAGTSANTLDWKRTIGPVNQRKNVVDHDKPQFPDFGVDEAWEFCEQPDSTMIYVYNFGKRNATDVVEYLNAPNNGSNPNGGTDWAAVRVTNGLDQKIFRYY